MIVLPYGKGDDDEGEMAQVGYVCDPEYPWRGKSDNNLVPWKHVQVELEDHRKFVGDAEAYVVPFNSRVWRRLEQYTTRRQQVRYMDRITSYPSVVEFHHMRHLQVRALHRFIESKGFDSYLRLHPDKTKVAVTLRELERLISETYALCIDEIKRSGSFEDFLEKVWAHRDCKPSTYESMKALLSELRKSMKGRQMARPYDETDDSLEYEGFWWSEYDDDLPMPVASDEPWEGQDEFLKMLRELEDRLMAEYQGMVDKANAGEGKYEEGAVVAYRGFSQCRLCLCANGSREFRYKGWVWPSGFRHCIEAHNVRPSSDFVHFIKEEARC